MNSKSKLKFNFVFVIFLLLAVACSRQMFTAEGKFVAEERRLDLKEGGPFPRDWQGRHLDIKYEYVRKQDDLQIMGTILFKKEKKLANFRCSIVLIDSAGTVLRVQGLVVSGGRQEIKEIPFKNELQLPPDAHSIAFSYSGTSGGTGQSGSPKSFWSSPWS